MLPKTTHETPLIHAVKYGEKSDLTNENGTWGPPLYLTKMLCLVCLFFSLQLLITYGKSHALSL